MEIIGDNEQWWSFDFFVHATIITCLVTKNEYQK